MRLADATSSAKRRRRVLTFFFGGGGWGGGGGVGQITMFRWTPHPVIETMRDNRDYIIGPLIFLLYHYYRAGGPPNLLLF